MIPETQPPTSVTVVALIHPLPGKAPEVLAAFAEVTPLVHQEPGCELYAAHTDGEVVIMVERWTTRADLDAHSAGAPLVRLGELNAGLLGQPAEVWVLDEVPLGDLSKGMIPRPQ
ncbi:MAG TPA: antibiotic biosynthesis monooxygenase family protein [Propionibacteriaceae bacterium]|nr:antibiotic biosynthesis monooxygenase family protein [Propionibacteriaceae bacterium]